MKKKCKFHYSILFFIFLPLLIFLLKDITVTFYNNDDFFLKLIASGEFTGTPQSHLLHIGYLTGILLSTLYTLLPSVPWYGILLFSYGYLSIMLSVYTVSKQIEKTRHRIIASVLMTFTAVCFLWIHIIELQYTTVTAIVCAAALVHFYLAEESEHISDYIKANIPGLVFFFLAMELRDKACLMFLPTFFLVGLIKYAKNRKLFKPLLAYGGILLCLVLLTLGIQKIAYSDEAWNSFKTYNTARENIVDYNGYPDYEEYRAEYEALGITYESYLSASTRYQLLLDENINTEFMVEMEALSHHFEPDVKQMLHNFLERHISSYIDRPLNLIVYVLYFFTGILIIVGKRPRAFLDLAALFAGRTIIWGYLLFIGRPMPRVTQGVYMMEFLLLLAIIFGQKLCFVRTKKEIREESANNKTKLSDGRKLLQRITGIVFAVAVIFTAIKWGLPNTVTIMDHSQTRYDYSVAYREMQEYFYTNQDNVYLLDTNSFSYFTEDAFAQTAKTAGNCVLLGSWHANSPWTDSIAAKYGIESYETAAVTQDNVYFVFMNTETTGYEYLENYFHSRYPETSLVLQDTVNTSNGLEFYIMQVQSN